MFKLTTALVFVALALIWNVGQAAAQSCFQMGAGLRFDLQVTAETTISPGSSVQSLVGKAFEVGTSSAATTGTAFREPDVGELAIRVALTTTTSTGVTFYSARLTGIADPLRLAFAGSFTIWQQGMPEPFGTGNAFVVDCQTGELMHF